MFCLPQLFQETSGLYCESAHLLHSAPGSASLSRGPCLGISSVCPTNVFSFVVVWVADILAQDCGLGEKRSGGLPTAELSRVPLVRKATRTHRHGSHALSTCARPSPHRIHTRSRISSICHCVQPQAEPLTPLVYPDALTALHSASATGPE